MRHTGNEIAFHSMRVSNDSKVTCKNTGNPISRKACSFNGQPVIFHHCLRNFLSNETEGGKKISKYDK